MGVHADDPNVLEEVDRAVNDLGLRGIKLGPNYQTIGWLKDGTLLTFERNAIPAPVLAFDPRTRLLRPKQVRAVADCFSQ